MIWTFLIITLFTISLAFLTGGNEFGLLGLILCFGLIVFINNNGRKIDVERLCYIQKIIVENDEKVVLRKNEDNISQYRLELDDFFIDFNIYENSYNGEMDWSLLTDQYKVLKYFNVSDIDINENEIENDKYKPFKEKYLVLEKNKQK